MKLSSLSIQDFRSFQHFELKGLGRINLLVGTNNSGKTTVLEAINILMADGNFSPIFSALSRRGEDVYPYGEQDAPGYRTPARRQVDIRRLFRGHQIEIGRNFQLSAETDTGRVTMAASIEEWSKESQSGQRSLFGPRSFSVEPSPESPEDFLPPLSLSLLWNGPGDQSAGWNFPISPRGGIGPDPSKTVRHASRTVNGEATPVFFVNASSLTAESVSSLFEDIVLTPEEDLVTNAMRIIEPSIDRIASAGSEKFGRWGRPASRGGILVRLKGGEDRVPIGSMGDGIWRLLGLALSAVQSKNGFLLVDEIDTGLHHTVMEDMWRFLYQCAQRYGLQIVATTHSRDCYHALAAICREEVSEGSDVTVSRIERGREEAVTYTEQEIIAAADRDIEVR